MEKKIKKLCEGLSFLGYFEERNKNFEEETKFEEQEDDEQQKLQKFLINSESRIRLFEWLIEKYDAKLLEQFEISNEKDWKTERIKRIFNIFNLIGILYANKYSKNTDYLKFIEGTLGLETSLKFLLRAVKFVKIAHEMFDEKNNGQTYEDDLFYNKIMDECCLKKKELINEKANIFPLFFPQKDQNSEKNLTILERVHWEEHLLEEKSLKINSNLISPYKDLNLSLENNNKSLKDEYKMQIDSFETNFKNLSGVKADIQKFEKDLDIGKNKIVFAQDYPKKLKKFMEIRRSGNKEINQEDSNLLKEMMSEQLVFQNLYTQKNK